MEIGLVGLGVMGARMAARLLASDLHLSVYDIDTSPLRKLAKAGARTCRSAAEVAGASDCLISMLPSPSVTRDVIIGSGGAFTGLRPGTIFIDTSTSDPMLTREIARKLKPRKVGVLDAPVSGGMVAAENGTLTFMVGGRKSVLRRVEPILKHLGQAIYHVGPVGSAHTLKLINNMLFTIIMAGTAEALSLAKKSGIDPALFRDVINSSTGRSFASDVKLRDFVIPRNFSPGFTVNLQIKDLDLALQMGQTLDAPLVLAAIVRQAYQALMVKGLGQKDTSIITTLFDEIMGVNH
jgi:3-hydroxyisobutyrate dehydrogenase